MVQADIAKAVGVDLVAIRMNNVDEAQKAITMLRGNPKTSAAPVILIVSGTDMATLRPVYQDNPRVNLVRAGAQDEQFGAAVDAVMKSASGGRITDAEAEEYAIKALSALRDIAIARNTAYRVGDAESALADALVTRSGGVRMMVADIMALIDSDTAQRKLFDAALGAQADEQVELLSRVADSVRLFGDRAEKRHVDALLELIAKATGPTADAAAAVHGALNLPASDAVKLIPQPQ